MLGFFGLGGIFYVAVLLTNAVAILSEDRFLARIGWGASQQAPEFGQQVDQASIKAKIVNLISSVRTVMRFPLIGFNIMIIVYELLLG